jgi:hypothetical protein
VEIPEAMGDVIVMLLIKKANGAAAAERCPTYNVVPFCALLCPANPLFYASTRYRS